MKGATVKRVSWLAVTGGALIVGGVAWWSLPAAAIVAGVALLAASWEANS